jgi:CRISPR-associated endonuclease Cas1
MRPQAIDSRAAWPADLAPPRGVLVLTGYGLDVRVWRGRLRIADGIGRNRREAIVHAATGRLRRLVILGHTGSISLEAIRWLADVGAAFIQVDVDGRVLAAFGPLGTDRPGLRRAQARALDTPLGVDVARRLIANKIAAQSETLAAITGADVTGVTLAALRDAATRIRVAATRDEVRTAEGMAAAVYWSALSAVPVRFAGRDETSVPAHWRAFGGRASPLTGYARLAASPANAILNYLYAILEAEATIAARVVGLDPGLGVLHADQLNRDSLSTDLIEPMRPIVDRYVFDLLRRRRFAASDFFETRQGVCGMTPSLARELAGAALDWGRLVGRVAEDVAGRLEDGGNGRPMPTPMSGRNRSFGRGPRSRSARPEVAVRIGRRCSWCGGPISSKRRTCSSTCAEAARGAQNKVPFYAAGPERLRKLRAAGVEPVGPEALARMASLQSQRQAEENLWNATHRERADPDSFQRDVLPQLQGVPLRELARRTGLSVAYCARIRRGEEVPHQRWWRLLGTASLG